MRYGVQIEVAVPPHDALSPENARRALMSSAASARYAEQAKDDTSMVVITSGLYEWMKHFPAGFIPAGHDVRVSVRLEVESAEVNTIQVPR